MKIIFGLGNPGPRYKNNRHNVGYLVIEELKKKFGLRMQRSIKLKAHLAKLKINDEEIVLVKPSTFMNNSGVCAKLICDNYHVSLNNCLVIYDDADLPLESLRLKKGGSSGGHRGMASIIDNLGTKKLDRLKIGIGRDNNDTLLADYVLSDFSVQEKDSLDKVVSCAAKAVLDWIAQGIDFAMAKHNRRKAAVQS